MADGGMDRLFQLLALTPTTAIWPYFCFLLCGHGIRVSLDLHAAWNVIKSGSDQGASNRVHTKKAIYSSRLGHLD